MNNDRTTQKGIRFRNDTIKQLERVARSMGDALDIESPRFAFMIRGAVYEFLDKCDPQSDSWKDNPQEWLEWFEGFVVRTSMADSHADGLADENLGAKAIEYRKELARVEK